jgi:hypothetical protein
LAEVAVLREPVSGVEFPDIREKYREYRAFARFRAIPAVSWSVISSTYNEIP